MSNPAWGGFTAISCVSRRFCVAVGPESMTTNQSLAARWNGLRWSALPTPPIGGVNAVSCVTATACIAVGGGAASWNGRSWRLQSLNDPRADLSAVSCVNAAFCVAVGRFENAILDGPTTAPTERWDGKHWSVQHAYSGPDHYFGHAYYSDVSCASLSRCVAVGSATPIQSCDDSPCVGPTPFADAWNGRTWSVEWAPGTQTISCVPDLCAAFVGGGFAMLDRQGWHTITVSNAPLFIGSISCASNRDCVAVGAFAWPGGPAVVRWNGSSWKSSSALSGTGI